MSNAKCPCCFTSFEPSAETVEIDFRIIGELGRDRSRNIYCQPCGKKILEKGLDYWVDSIESLIRSRLIAHEQPKGGSKG